LRRYQYTFDRAGNRLTEIVSVGGVADPTITYDYNAANQLIDDGTYTYEYDGNGNLRYKKLTGTPVEEYIWNRANRLVTWDNGTAADLLNYTYDGLNNRISRSLGTTSPTVTKYLLDLQPGLSVVLAATEDTDVTRYVHGPMGIHAQEDPAGAWSWMVQDGLGSVRSVVDNSVAVDEIRLNDPFGNQVTGAPYDYAATVYGFTGEVTETVNPLVHLRARDYNPALGVFTALDPFEGMPASPMSLNGYSWVEGNIVNFVDPTGMSALYGILGRTNVSGKRGSFGVSRANGGIFGRMTANFFNSGLCLQKQGTPESNLPARCELPPQPFSSGNNFTVDLNKVNGELVESYGVILTVQCFDNNSESGSLSWNDETGNTKANLEHAFSQIDRRLRDRTNGLGFKDVFGGVEFRLIPAELRGAALTNNPFRINFDADAISSASRSSGGAYGPASPGGPYGFVNPNDPGIQATVVHELGHILHLRTQSLSQSERGGNQGGGLYHTAQLFQLFNLAPITRTGGLREGVEFEGDEAVLEDAIDHFLNWVYKSYLGGIDPDNLRSPGAVTITDEDRLISRFWMGGKVRISDEVGYVWSRGIGDWAEFSSRSSTEGQTGIDRLLTQAG
jgi:RHS repeat-associated protein